MLKPAVLVALTVFLSSLLLMPAVAQTSNNQGSQAGDSSQQNPPLTDQSSYPKATHKMTAKEKSNTPSARGESVDLNSASKAELAALPGVGPDYAQTIIDARPFTAKEQLLQKKVVPPATYEKIKDKVTANGPKKQSTKAPQQ